MRNSHFKNMGKEFPEKFNVIRNNAQKTACHHAQKCQLIEGSAIAFYNNIAEMRHVVTL